MRPKCFLILVVAAWLTSILPGSSAAQMTPDFGPKQFTRIAGPPQTFSEAFQHCGTAPCQIVVINGNADDTNRISSASISVDGMEILGPHDFNQQMAKIVKPVVLGDQNQLMCNDTLTEITAKCRLLELKIHPLPIGIGIDRQESP